MSPVLHAIALLFLTAQAAAPAPEIARLIEQLGSKSFEEREAATAALKAVGKPALEPLRKAAATSGDAEVRRRAGNLVFLLDTRPFRLVRTLTGHAEAVVNVAFSSDGKLAVSASSDRTVRFWDTASSRPQAELAADRAWMSPDGSCLVTARSGDGELLVWDIYHRNLLRWLEGGFGCPEFVAISAESRRVVAGYAGEAFRTWDLSAGVERSSGPTGTGTDLRGPKRVAFSRDGQRLWTQEETSLSLWDLKRAGKVRMHVVSELGAITGLALSPDEQSLVVAGPVRKGPLVDDPPGAVLHVDAKTGLVTRSFVGHTGPVRALAFSRDGKLMLSAGDDRVVRVWDTNTGAEVGRLEGHTGSVLCIAVSMAGRTVLTGGADNTVRLWRISE